MNRQAPCGLVQVVQLLWDKSAQGGQGARDRNAVPQAFAVPEARLLAAADQVYIEEHHWSHHNGFAAPTSHRHQSISMDDNYSLGCVTVSGHPEGLLVQFRWEAWTGGAPNRWFLNVPRDSGATSEDYVVRVGEWMRVCYNGRFSSTYNGHWYYKQTTVNVAFFAEEPSGQVFLACAPGREFKLFADLW